MAYPVNLNNSIGKDFMDNSSVNYMVAVVRVKRFKVIIAIIVTIVIIVIAIIVVIILIDIKAII